MIEPINQENKNTEQKDGPESFFDKVVQKLISPHASVTDPAKRLELQFLSTILLVLASLTAVNIPLRLISGNASENPLLFAFFVIIILLLFTAYALSRSQYYNAASGIAISALTATVYVSFFMQGYPAFSLLWLVPIVIFGSTILSLRDTFIFAAANLLLLMILPVFISDLSFIPLAPTFSLLFVASALVLVLNQHRQRVETTRQAALTKANRELNSLSHSLEERIQERTQDLALAGEVGRVISQIHDLNALLTQAVSLIQERFDMYYTQIYLVGNDRETLVIRAGTGEVGKTLLAQSHTLFIDESSINGRAAARKEAIIVDDTRTSDFFLPNAALPDTRSEMAVPLIVQNRVVGVLDLQSDRPNALSEDNLPAFTALAGQLAVAIQNTNLLKEMEETTGFLDSVIESLPVMLFVKDAGDLRFVRWNQAGEDLTGFPKNEMIGKNDFDFFPEEEAKYFTTKDREVLEKGELVDIAEEPIKTVHQGTRLLHTRKVPIMDAQGKPLYLLGISEDITERKQMESDLAGRVNQLNLLNDIGRHASTVETVSEFLEWVCTRIPQTMRFPDECLVAIALDKTLYGDQKAKELKRHIVEDLQVQGETAGHIYIAYANNLHDFVDEESALIGGIGRRVSSFIETRRLLEQLQVQAADLRKVTEISTAVATTQNQYDLLEKVTRLTQEQFELDQTAVFLVEEGELALSTISGSSDPNILNKDIRISIGAQKSIVAKAARSRRAVMVNDVLHDPDYLPNPLLPETRSEIALPLIAADDALIGILDFQSNKPHTFNQDALNIYMTLAFQVAISWQNARQYGQTQEALEELSSLQRVITNESWDTFMVNRERAIHGFLANRHSVQPISPLESQDNAANKKATTFSPPDINNEGVFIAPVQVRGTAIGKLGVRSSADSPISEENQALITAISQQVAEALERARLFEETEVARAQTDQLFAGSERVVRATTMDEILLALVESTELKELNRVNFQFFDMPWGEEPPQTMTVSALWEKERKSVNAPGGLGTVYKLEDTPFIKLVSPDTPLIVRNVIADDRVDDSTRVIFENLGTKGIAIFPMVVGREWIGVVTCHSREPMELSDDAIRQISSLVDQASSVAQTQRLFEQTEIRAQQEQILRHVSERVYSTVDAESVLRTAVTEVSRALGLEAFVYLDEQAGASAKTNGTTKKIKAKSSK